MSCCLWGRTESDTTEATEQQQQQTLKVMNKQSVQWSWPGQDAQDSPLNAATLIGLPRWRYW